MFTYVSIEARWLIVLWPLYLMHAILQLCWRFPFHQLFQMDTFLWWYCPPHVVSLFIISIFRLMVAFSDHNTLWSVSNPSICLFVFSLRKREFGFKNMCLESTTIRYQFGVVNHFSTVHSKSCLFLFLNLLEQMRFSIWGNNRIRYFLLLWLLWSLCERMLLSKRFKFYMCARHIWRGCARSAFDAYICPC